MRDDKAPLTTTKNKRSLKMVSTLLQIGRKAGLPELLQSAKCQTRQETRKKADAAFADVTQCRIKKAERSAAQTTQANKSIYAASSGNDTAGSSIA